ncbi:hypothetical protein EV182_003635 [Spiromyces aspiralis]|uniref:Uncharacterized protein n=1 Tax=Spiromyces aspiralis TaxID=68401 RepID=A0ACC1HTH6_9FUNG|nr:hypothetical protein EV182_003635 [Spiromyces aspiralis]
MADEPKVSSPAANALIYCTLAAFLLLGVYSGRKSFRDKDAFIKATRSQGVSSLGLNFVAVNLGSSIFYGLPEVGTIAGVVGVIAYAFGSSFPLFVFAIVGPMFRKHNSEQWSMTNFIMERYGRLMHIVYGVICSLFVCMYAVSELSTIYGTYHLLTDINPLAPLIVICIVTTIYTAFGGVLASMFTDTIQVFLICIMVVVAAISIGTSVRIDKAIMDQVGLVQPTKVSWQLFGIMIVAITFSDMYHQGFWQRTFASRTNRDLAWSAVIGFCLSFPLFTLIGMAGPLAAWSGTWSPPQKDDDPPASMAFFSILAAAPGWVAGLTLVLSTSLSCCAMDTLQCTLAASLYDLVEQRIGMYIIRAIIILLNVPIIVLAMRAPDVLQIWLFADLLACATVLPVLLGLIPKLNFLVQWDVFVGCIAGIVSVGIAGTIYFHDSDRGWRLLMIDGGLYVDDYSVLMAFLVAPTFSTLFTFISAGVRISIYRLLKKPHPIYQNTCKTYRIGSSILLFQEEVPIHCTYDYYGTNQDTSDSSGDHNNDSRCLTGFTTASSVNLSQ